MDFIGHEAQIIENIIIFTTLKLFFSLFFYFGSGAEVRG